MTVERIKILQDMPLGEHSLTGQMTMSRILRIEKEVNDLRILSSADLSWMASEMETVTSSGSSKGTWHIAQRIRP